MNALMVWFTLEAESFLTSTRWKRYSFNSDMLMFSGLFPKCLDTDDTSQRADGYTAIKNLRIEVEQEDEIFSQYNEAEKRMLDKINIILSKKGRFKF
ncbi:MAG: hypothetical protein WD426_19365 [Anditalea sp.]